MAEKKMEEEFLTCSICYDVFKEPKTLSCLHRFCGACLHNFILSQKKTSLQRQNGFPCPVCREVIKAPELGTDPSEWTNLFKTDFNITSLIRFVKRTDSVRTQNAKLKNACSVHKQKELDLYCKDCHMIMCHLCAGINHRGCSDVVTLEEVAAKQKTDIQKSLKSIEKEIEETNTSRERVLDNFDKLRSNAEIQIKRCADGWRLAIENEEDRLLQNLKNYCEKVYERITPKLMEFDKKISGFNEKTVMLKNRCNDLPDFEVMNMFPKGIGLHTIGLDSYKNVVTHISHLNIKFEQTSKPGVTIGDVIFTSQNETSSSASLPKQIEITSESGSNITYTLDNHETVLYSTDISQKDNPFHGLDRPSTNSSSRRSLRDKLSKLISSPFSQSGSSASAENNDSSNTQRSCNTNNKGAQFCIPEETNSLSQSSLRQSSMSSEVRSAVQKLRTISTRFRDDSADPKLRDLIVVGRGGPTVIVTDWSNQCVKAFCVRRDRDSRLEVGDRPWSITQLSESLAAVSLPLSKQICILKITSPLTMQKSFVAAKSYSGLATLNSQMLVASGNTSPPCVDIINLYGEILWSFSKSKSGSQLFHYPSYVCVTPSLSILVSDKKQGAVICMSHKGEIKFKFHPKHPKNLQEPCGLCTTPSGHVVVVETRGLLQLTPSGQMERPLIRRDDGYINDPKGVAVGSDGLIYVTTDEQEVAVFQINV